MRRLAIRIVGEWLKTARFPDRLLPAQHPERARLVELVYGVVRRRDTLRWFIGQCSDREPAPSALPTLLVGAYQVLYMDGIADHAAVHETVASLPESQARLKGYVNAVLRRLVRERDGLRRKLAEQPLAIRESHPECLTARWVSRYGIAATATLCAGNNTRPCVTLRPRPPWNVPRYQACLAAQSIDATPHPAAPDRFLVLPHGYRVPELPGFAEGHIAIQDPATAAAVDLLEVAPHHTVLDTCAAPGGKTIMIAELLADAGTLYAVDRYPDRLATLRENLARYAIEGVHITACDAAGPELAQAFGDMTFDRILLDVPCTNTGVLARRPDARWRFTAARLSELARLQQRLLDAAAPLLAPGGRLVYSTCSLEPEENAQRVHAWLDHHDAFEQAETTDRFPPRDQCDGAYAAAIVRRADA